MSQSELLQSEKSTCTRKRLLKTLSAVKHLKLSSEGAGGEKDYGSGWEVGTGLRAPDMPLYDMPRTWRHSVIKHLINAGLLTGTVDDDGDYTQLKTTPEGEAVLSAETCPECDSQYAWYLTATFTQTGAQSGYKNESRAFMCKHEADKFNDSPNSSPRKGIVKRIEEVQP